eukprot:m.265353 g.265353  ORF g.265353 m.265353 type:complete len:53 (-) comp28934_c0_seq1:328-486(-)
MFGFQRFCFVPPLSFFRSLSSLPPSFSPPPGHLSILCLNRSFTSGHPAEESS